MQRSSLVWVIAVMALASYTSAAFGNPINITQSVTGCGLASGPGTSGGGCAANTPSGTAGGTLFLPHGGSYVGAGETGAGMEWDTIFSANSFEFFNESASTAAGLILPPSVWFTSAQSDFSYDLSFELLTLHSFTLEGNLASSASGAVGGGSASVLFEMNGYAPFSVSSAFDQFVNKPNESLNFSNDGVLAAGVYHIHFSVSTSAGAEGLGNGNGSYYVALSFADQTTTPIPEPETYAVLLAGLALLGFETRRRRKLQHTA